MSVRETIESFLSFLRRQESIKLICVILLFACLACKKEIKVNSENESIVPSDSVIEDVKPHTESIPKPEKLKPGIAYVNAENGLNVRDLDGNIVGKLDNAERVEILGFTEDSIKVIEEDKVLWGRKAIINYYHQYKINGRTTRSLWDKAHIFEKYLAHSSVVKLYQSELCKIVNWNENYTKSNISCLDSILDLKLINRKEYDQQASLVSSTLFVKDNPEVKTDENKIILPIKDSVVTLVSIQDEENTEEYQFIGEVPLVSSYLISGSYYETSNYFLMNNTSGERICSFDNMPRFSPNGMYMISLNMDALMDGGTMQIVKALDGKIDKIHNFEFKNWAITQDGDITWLSDNELIIKVKHVNAYWNESGHVSDTSHQLLKITIL